MAQHSESKTAASSAQTGSTAPSTTGTMTLKELNSFFPMASKDDPIFKIGFVIGEKRMTPLFKGTPEKA